MTPMAQPLLPGLALRGYRSFYGDNPQFLSPLTKVTLLAGQNNAGKSNALQFVKRFMNQGPHVPEPLDVPTSITRGDGFTLGLARYITDDELAQVATGTRLDHRHTLELLREIVHNEETHLTGDDLVWFFYHLPNAGDGRSWGGWNLDRNQATRIASRFAGRQHLLSDLTLALFSRAGENTDNVISIMERFSPLSTLPTVEVVEAFRQIRPSHTTDADISPNGEGLVRGLQKLERPSISRQEDKQRFEAINQFVRTVLEDDSAVLEIPHDAETILVHRGDRTLPLEHLGTGIHQVIILASAATLMQGRLVCIEEPEVHLHPLLQRKLVRYLKQETSNQYLIATHSAHLLDHEHSSVFHVQLTAAGTEVQHAGTPQQLSSVCADLGYRPSDLLQANAVIWVEGPSDRAAPSANPPGSRP